MLTGAEIKELRKRKGYTQDQLAAIVGVTRSSVYAWERGMYPPEGKNAVSLADALDIDVKLLMPSQQSQNVFVQQIGRTKRPKYEMQEDGTIVPIPSNSVESFLSEYPDLEIWFRTHGMTEKGKKMLADAIRNSISSWEMEEGE